VETVVAMVYEVLETAGSMFTQAFYYRLLSPGSNTLSAARFGREQLLLRNRVGVHALVDAAIQWCRDTGFIRVCVWVDDTRSVVTHWPRNWTSNRCPT
jgi:hypothetical protein